MLATYFDALPYTKFILIEDSVTAKGGEILKFLVENHEKNQDYRTYFLAFERNFHSVETGHPLSVCHDFSSNLRNWLSADSPDLKGLVSSLKENCVVIVDSLIHVLYRYGLLETYHIFSELKNKTNVHQIIAVLHTDLLEEKQQVMQCFQHIATLHLELDTRRVSYTYKKSQRKVVKQVEEYRFENNKFITEPIKKPDNTVIRETIEEITAENLSTFRIGLSEKEKESRDRENDIFDSNIEYALDPIDDWDEEDPDDDLDI